MSPEVVFEVVDGEAVLLDMNGSTYFSLNRVGTEIWAHLTAADSDEEIISAICRRFETDRQTAESDLRLLLAELMRRGLILG